jgi:hypothetical protein
MTTRQRRCGFSARPQSRCTERRSQTGVVNAAVPGVHAARLILVDTADRRGTVPAGSGRLAAVRNRGESSRLLRLPDSSSRSMQDRSGFSEVRADQFWVSPDLQGRLQPVRSDADPDLPGSRFVKTLPPPVSYNAVASAANGEGARVARSRDRRRPSPIPVCRCATHVAK